MTKSKMNPKVDFYFSKAKKWQEELEKLRTIGLDCRAEDLVGDSGAAFEVIAYPFSAANCCAVSGG